MSVQSPQNKDGFNQSAATATGDSSSMIGALFFIEFAIFCAATGWLVNCSGIKPADTTHKAPPIVQKQQIAPSISKGAMS